MSQQTTVDPQKHAFLERLKAATNKARQDDSLRWNQLDVLDVTTDFLEANEGTHFDAIDTSELNFEINQEKGTEDAALIESSPGSGKTRIMGVLAREAGQLDKKPEERTDTIKTLILTPRIDLNRQTLNEFKNELDIKLKDIAIYDSNQSAKRKEKAPDAPVLVAAYQSLPTMLEEGVISLDPKSPNYRGLVIMDEAHEITNSTRKSDNPDTPDIKSFINDNQMTFLFTGTDDGVSERDFDGRVPTIYSKRLVQAHNEGLTCDHIYPGLIDIAVKAGDGEESEVSAEPSEEYVDELNSHFASHPKVIQAAVDTQLTKDHQYMGPLNNYKSLFFVDGVDAGRDGAAYYNKKAAELGLTKLHAAHLHGDTKKTERQRILKEFNEGKITAIFNDRMVTFGFDDREVAVIHDLKQHRRDNPRELARMEQIFTRGTRRCNNFKDVNNRSGEKQALLLSYRPIDAEGNPANVFTAMDVLKGIRMQPQQNHPQWRGSGLREGRTPTEYNEDFDVAMHFDFGEQVEIAETMQREQNKTRSKVLPVATADWIAISRIGELQGGSTKIAKDVAQYLNSNFDNSKEGIQTFTYGENIFHLQKMRSHARIAVYCLKDDLFNAGVALEQGFLKKDSEWLTATEVRSQPHGSSKKTKQALRDLDIEYDKIISRPLESKIVKVVYGGNTVRMQTMLSGAHTVLVYNKDDLITAGLISSKMPPKKSDDWLVALEIARSPGGQTNRSLGIVKSIVDKFEQVSPSKSDYKQYVIDSEAYSFRMRRMYAEPKTSICINREDLLSASVIKDKPLSKKTDEWMNETEVLRSVGGRSKKTRNALGKIKEDYEKTKVKEVDPEQHTLEHNGIGIRVKMMKAGTLPVLCFYKPDMISAGYIDVRNLEHQSEAWYTYTRVKKELGVQNKATKEAFRILEACYRENRGTRLTENIMLVEHDGHKYRVQDMIAGATRVVFCVNGEDLMQSGILYQDRRIEKTSSLAPDASITDSDWKQLRRVSQLGGD